MKYKNIINNQIKEAYKDIEKILKDVIITNKDIKSNKYTKYFYNRKDVDQATKNLVKSLENGIKKLKSEIN